MLKLLSCIALFVCITNSNDLFAGGCTTPAVPTGVSATDINPWDAQINYTSGGGSTVGIYSEICTNAAFTANCDYYTLNASTSRTNRFESLTCGTTYYYRVAGYNSAGSGCYSATVTGSFTTPACPAAVSNSCSGATTLTNGGATRCFTTAGATSEAGEGVCGTAGAGCIWETVWFKFQATTTESTVTLNRSNNSYFQTDLVAFGPYASAAAASSGCMPGAGNIVTNGGTCVTDFDDYDPIYSISFPTVANQWYLIQVMNEDCDIFTNEDYQGCIQVDPTPTNNKASGSSLIDECGTIFNGTNKGYSPSNIMPGNENLDGNAGTTCPTCETSGDNVPYVVNNDSWFNFCATTTGNWSVDFEGITNCINGGGLQMTIFRGTPTNLTTVWNAGSPSLEGSTQTSSAFTVNANECIYMVVDGFAGDQCDYQYQLNNLTTPCNLLPVDLGDFFAVNIENKNKLVWTTYSESNSDYFLVERSADGINWRNIAQVEAAHESNGYLTYNLLDESYETGMNYYRLSQFDLDGKKQLEKITQIDNSIINEELIGLYNILGQQVDQNYKGIVIRLFKSGRTDKIMQ
ncbi:MAG: hypothetical protein ACO1O6_08535 [Bacteroidota bacterium]